MKKIYQLIYLLIRITEKARIYNHKKRLKFYGKNFTLNSHVDITSHSTISFGNNCSLKSYASLYGGGTIEIGDNVRIGAGCRIYSVTHPLNMIGRQHKNIFKKVTIGNNVWIGGNAVILPGITIGHNSIIGAGSVLTKSVGNNEMWAGNPACFIKTIIIK